MKSACVGVLSIIIGRYSEHFEALKLPIPSDRRH